MNLGCWQQDRRKKWMWCCGQRFWAETSGSQSESFSTDDDMHCHGSRDCGSQYFDWNVGFDDRIIMVGNIFTSTLTKS